MIFGFVHHQQIHQQRAEAAFAQRTRQIDVARTEPPAGAAVRKQDDAFGTVRHREDGFEVSRARRNFNQLFVIVYFQ